MMKTIDMTHLAPPPPDGFMIGQEGLHGLDLTAVERQAIVALALMLDEGELIDFKERMPIFYSTRIQAEAVMNEMRRRLPNGPALYLIEIKANQARRASE